MVAKHFSNGCVPTRDRRHGVAAVEFAVCLPVMFVILFRLWEAGRMAEVQNVAWSSAREGARDAAEGKVNLEHYPVQSHAPLDHY
jgi:Flp pilus assembly protein TadG